LIDDAGCCGDFKASWASAAEANTAIVTHSCTVLVI
jgi:hypothetical protein